MCKLDCEHPEETSRKLTLKKEFAFSSTVGKKSSRTIEAHGVHVVGRTPLPNGERRIVIVGKPKLRNENITIKVKRGDN